MRVTGKRYRIACRYKNINDVDSIQKYQIEFDLLDLGIDVKPVYDKETLFDIAKIVSKHIIEDVEGK